jgi:osmoprotectant transport system permease protein
MDILAQAVTYALAHRAELAQATVRHLELVAIALGVALVLCVPLGIVSARSRWVSTAAINAVNALRVMPSLAVLFIAIPYLGLTFQAAALALTVLALPPVLINTDAAFRAIAPAVREAAYGMGMSPRQTLWQVEFPLALPVIIAGIRTAAVEVIASATLAAFVGAGGLGMFITRGFALYDSAILLVGAIPVALLAVATELGLGRLQRAAQYEAHYATQPSAG